MTRSLLISYNDATGNLYFLDFQAFLVDARACIFPLAHALLGTTRKLDIFRALVIGPYFDIQASGSERFRLGRLTLCKGSHFVELNRLLLMRVSRASGVDRWGCRGCFISHGGISENNFSPLKYSPYSIDI
jgi:hypothetical protein